MFEWPDNGMVHLKSKYNVADTIERVLKVVAAKGLRLFARIDHAAAAESVGLKMRPTEVLVFGSPKAGTPVMLAAPTIAIDLPLKALVWQDDHEAVWLSYNSADYLKNRHNLPAALVPNISALPAILESALL